MFGVPSIKIQQFQELLLHGLCLFPSPRGRNVLRKIFNSHCGINALQAALTSEIAEDTRWWLGCVPGIENEAGDEAGVAHRVRPP